VLDLVNPVGARRRFIGGGRQAGLDETRPASGQALTHKLDRYAANLGGRGEESNRYGAQDGSAFDAHMAPMEVALFLLLWLAKDLC
jgi:hypothetical protein